MFATKHQQPKPEVLSVGARSRSTKAQAEKHNAVWHKLATRDAQKINIQNVQPTIQTKLTVGEPNDKYEQEADRVADQVMRMPELCEDEDLGTQRTVEPPTVQRMCAVCEEELQRQPMEEIAEVLQIKYVSGDVHKRKVDMLADHVFEMTKPPKDKGRQLGYDPGTHFQRKLTSGTNSSSVSTNGRMSSLGEGHPLPRSERAYFEPRFGVNLSPIRLHTTPNAERMADDLSARAFTYGPHIAFARNEFSEGTSLGRHLLAHELVHTIQQGAAYPLMARRGLVSIAHQTSRQLARKPYPNIHSTILNEIIAKRKLNNAVITTSWPEIEALFWNVDNKQQLLDRLKSSSDAMAVYFRDNLSPAVQHVLIRILHTGSGKVTVGSNATNLRNQKKAEIKGSPSYTSLSKEDKDVADEIIVAAEASNQGLFYMFMLKALLETPSASASSTSDKNKKKTEDASVIAQGNISKRSPVVLDKEEARARAIKSSDWIERESDFGFDSSNNKAKYKVEASNPKNIVVQISIFVKGGKDPGWRNKIVGMEDEIEKKTSKMAKSGYTVDVMFLATDQAGALFIDVSDLEQYRSYALTGNVKL